MKGADSCNSFVSVSASNSKVSCRTSVPDSTVLISRECSPDVVPVTLQPCICTSPVFSAAYALSHPLTADPVSLPLPRVTCTHGVPRTALLPLSSSWMVGWCSRTSLKKAELGWVRTTICAIGPCTMVKGCETTVNVPR